MSSVVFGSFTQKLLEEIPDPHTAYLSILVQRHIIEASNKYAKVTKTPNIAKIGQKILHLRTSDRAQHGGGSHIDGSKGCLGAGGLGHQDAGEGGGGRGRCRLRVEGG